MTKRGHARSRRYRGYGKRAGASRTSASPPTLPPEVSQHRIGGFGAHHFHQLFTRGSPHACETSKRREKRLAAPRSDSVDHVQLRSEIPFRPRQTMERDGKSMRLVANPLYEEKRRTLC